MTRPDFIAQQIVKNAIGCLIPAAIMAFVWGATFSIGIAPLLVVLTPLAIGLGGIAGAGWARATGARWDKSPEKTARLYVAISTIVFGAGAGAVIFSQIWIWESPPSSEHALPGAVLGLFVGAMLALPSVLLGDLGRRIYDEFPEEEFTEPAP